MLEAAFTAGKATFKAFCNAFEVITFDEVGFAGLDVIVAKEVLDVEEVVSSISALSETDAVIESIASDPFDKGVGAAEDASAATDSTVDVVGDMGQQHGRTDFFSKFESCAIESCLKER